MATIFTRIVQGEIPCYKIAESDEFLAFLDINPLAKGHTLVIPKQETDYIFDLEDDLLARMQVFSKKVALAIDSVMDCKRVGVVVLGLAEHHLPEEVVLQELDEELVGDLAQLVRRGGRLLLREPLGCHEQIPGVGEAQ